MYVADHKPVMLKEVLEYLAPKDGETYVDCTFGRGGYSRAILESCNCKVIAIDRDPDVKIFADKLKEQFGNRFSFFNQKFSKIKDILQEIDVKFVDGVILDLGVSSMQLETAPRGFSFNLEGGLDMRMEKAGLSAFEVINHFKEEEIANIIYQYGDEHYSRRIARAIIAARNKNPIETTTQLAKIIRSVLPKGGKIDSATKSFQGIRIFVNQEMEELNSVLVDGSEVLAENGRMVVVTFHSTEDRIVKKFFQENSGKVISNSRYLPDVVNNNKKIFDIIAKKAIKPSETELRDNNRARSAKLRAVKKLGELS